MGFYKPCFIKCDSMGKVIALIEPLRKITTSKYTSGKLAVLTKPDGVQLLTRMIEADLRA